MNTVKLPSCDKEKYRWNGQWLPGYWGESRAKHQKNFNWLNKNFLFLDIGTRTSSTPTPELKCFLCDLSEKSDNPLHLVQSLRLDQRVRRCENMLKDSSLYAKLQNRDLIAQNTMYHCVSYSYRGGGRGGDFTSPSYTF